MLRSLVLAIGFCALMACSSHTPEETAAKPAQAKQKTVLDDQLKALEKAKAVQQTVDDAAKAQQNAIDENGG